MQSFLGALLLFMVDVYHEPVHKMSARQIIRELEAAGFRHLKTVGTLPLQHLVIFQK